MTDRGILETVAFPVPFFGNRVFRVSRDPAAGRYEELPPGTPLSECPFAGVYVTDPEKFDGYFLAKIVPNSQTGLHDWFFLNERANEDDYNFETAYEGEDPEFPIVTRTYVMLRSRYEAAEFTETDPVIEGLTLSSQRQLRVEDPVVDSLFVGVQRVYQRIPGKVFTGKTLTPEGQVGSLTRQLVAPGETVVPSAFVSEGEVKPESGAASTKTVVTVPEVFDARVLGKERPDLVPPKFRPQVPVQTDEGNLEGQAAVPTLGQEDLARSEQNLTKFVKRIRRLFRSLVALPVSLTQKATTPEKLLAQVTETLQQGDTSEVPTALKQVESEALGDGTYIVRTTTVPEVFEGKQVSSERPDPAPLKFRAAAPLTAEERTVEGQVPSSVSLGSGELEKSEQQITKFTKRVRSVLRSLSGGSAALTSYFTTPKKQLATVVERIQVGGSAGSPSATVDVESEALGDGTVIVKTTTVPEVFPETRKTARRIVTIPERFFASKPETVTEEIVSGRVSSTELTLTTDEIVKAEEQVTEFTKRNTLQKQTISNPEILFGDELEEAFGVSIPYKESIEKTRPPTNGRYIDTVPLGDGKYLVKEYEKSSVETALLNIRREYPAKVNIPTLPPVLKTLEITYDTTVDSSDGNTKSFGQGEFTGGLSLSGGARASASVSATPQAKIELEELPNTNLSAKVVVFFTKEPFTESDILSKSGASAVWPTFKPKSFVFDVIGRRQSVEGSIQGEVALSETGVRGTSSNGGGKSTAVTSLVVRIPPCLTGFKTITANATKSAMGSATGSILNNPLNYTASASVSLSKRINLSPTSPIDVPRSGVYLVDYSVEFFKFGHYIVKAVVLDASIFN